MSHSTSYHVSSEEPGLSSMATSLMYPSTTKIQRQVLWQSSFPQHNQHKRQYFI